MILEELVDFLLLFCDHFNRLLCGIQLYTF